MNKTIEKGKADKKPYLFFISMKKVLIALGIILCLTGLFPVLQYMFDFNILSSYGKGFILGKALLIFIGLSCIIIGVKKK